MGTQQEVIKKFVKSLDNSSTYGTAALDEAVNYASSGIYSNWSDLVTAFVNDVSLHGGDGASNNRILNSKTDSFLKEYCGIDLTNTDTGAITGYDAGASNTQISAEDIVPESNTAAATYPTESRTTYNGVTIIWPDASELTTKEKEIISALYSWWLQPALDLVEASIGISFKESDVKSRTMTITFDRYTSGTVLASANLYNLTIYSQAFESIDITGGEYSGQRARGVYFDRILAHELTHAIMSTNETEVLWDNTPICVDEGIAELVHGADDGRKGEIVRLAQAVNASTLEKAMYYTRSSSEDYYDSYAGGYMLFRYLAKQVSEKLFTGTAVVDLSKAGTSVGNYVVASSNTGRVSAAFTTDSVAANQTRVGTVSGGVYTATFDAAQILSALNSNHAWTITGTSGNDTIAGSDSADSINGGAGNDLITGGGGNDTLTGGAGNDTFTCSSGNVVITDYTEGGDAINLTKDSVDSSYLDGSDVVLKFGSESIRIVDGAKKLITVDSTSSIYGIPVGLTYSSDETAATLDNDFGGTLKATEYYSSVKTITAATRSAAVYINGNTLANSIDGSGGNDTIYGGNGNDSIFGNIGNDRLYGDAGFDFLSGGTGNDTLSGGSGNDTLTGGLGKDVFIYSSGNDVITDYSAGQDSIKLSSGAIVGSSVIGSDVVLKVGNGSITIKKGKGKSITVVDSTGKTTRKPYRDTTTLMINDSDSAAVTVDSSVLIIDASSRTKAIKITGNELDNSITGGSGNDTLAGGTGRDVFIYSSGNDVITDYTTGQDSIKLKSDSITSSSLKGSDVVLKVGSGSITVKNAKTKAITIIDSNDNTSSRIYPLSTTLTVTNADLTTINADSAIKTINAATRTKAVKITGNALANTIRCGSGADTIYGGAGNDSIFGNAGNDSLNGGSGNDTLIGGKGDDTLIGGVGKDVFVYADGDGNDIIKDYAAGQDKIKLTSGSIDSSSVKGSDVILKIGSGSITLKNANGKEITVTDSSNDTTTQVYTNSKNFIEDSWFLEDITPSSDLTSILDSEEFISDLAVVRQWSTVNNEEIIGSIEEACSLSLSQERAGKRK